MLTESGMRQTSHKIDPFGPRNIYNSKTIGNLTKEDKDRILEVMDPWYLTPKQCARLSGVNLMDIYTNKYVDLGAKNNSAVTRMAEICAIIYEECLPLPPSPFSEFLVGRTSGMDKLDVSFTIDGNKGDGKSYSSLSIGERFGMDMAAINGGSPFDYFSLDNCALLEDTEAITRIMQRAKKRQFILLDDAQVAVGNRDFAQQKNKNFNRILSICRTMRWVICLNTQLSSHIDLGIRDLTDFKLNIFKPNHDRGFNLLKIFSSDVKIKFNKKSFHEKRLSFYDKKFDIWCAYHPDIFAPYKGMAEKYDVLRDEAAQRIISETADEEAEMANPVGKREKEWEETKKKYIPIIRKTIAEDGKVVIRSIVRRTGLHPDRVYRLLGEITYADTKEKEAKAT